MSYYYDDSEWVTQMEGRGPGDFNVAIECHGKLTTLTGDLRALRVERERTTDHWWDYQGRYFARPERVRMIIEIAGGYKSSTIKHPTDEDDDGYWLH